MKRKKKETEEFDYASFEQEAISKLRSGKGLTGEDGALTGLISRIVTAAFEGEISDHLTQDDSAPNRRNGYTNKTILLIPTPQVSRPTILNFLSTVHHSTNNLSLLFIHP